MIHESQSFTANKYASNLFVTQGYHATWLSQIIKESECPRCVSKKWRTMSRRTSIKAMCRSASGWRPRRLRSATSCVKRANPFSAAWQNVISSRLQMTGIGQAKAAELVTVIVSLLEGALLLAITNRDTTLLLSASKCVPYLITKCPSL